MKNIILPIVLFMVVVGQAVFNLALQSEVKTAQVRAAEAQRQTDAALKAFWDMKQVNDQNLQTAVGCTDALEQTNATLRRILH